MGRLPAPLETYSFDALVAELRRVTRLQLLQLLFAALCAVLTPVAVFTLNIVLFYYCVASAILNVLFVVFWRGSYRQRLVAELELRERARRGSAAPREAI